MINIENPDNFRSNIVSKLSQLENKNGVKLNSHNRCINVEKSIFNYTLNEASNRNTVKKWENKYFTLIYLDRLKTMFYNLKNTDLIEKINKKEIKSKNVAFLTHQELDPARWSELIDKKIKRDKSKTETKLIEGEFTCRRCGSNYTTHYQMQTRSADEPMTTFIQCQKCPNSWRC